MCPKNSISLSTTQPGLFQLSTREQKKALSMHFERQPYYISKDIDATQTKNNPLRYFINLTAKIIIFATPIEAVNLDAYLGILKTYLTLENIYDYHLVIPLMGQSIMGRHIVSFYKAPGARSIPIIFDSKAGASKRFFNSQKNTAAQTIKYVNLGTQCFFDSRTCGYHTLANTTNIVLLIQAEETVNKNSLLKSFKKNNLNNFSIPLLKNSDIPLNINYLAFILQAWRVTFPTRPLQEESTVIKFKHYVLGWPTSKEIWRKILYLLFLGFLLSPLKNLLNMLLVFPFQLLTNSTDYIKHQLFLWTTPSSGLQYLRTSLLLVNYLFYSLFNALSVILKTGFSLIPTPYALNAQQKNSRNNADSMNVERTIDDFDYLNDLVTAPYVVETVKPSNDSTLPETNSQFFKPAILQDESQAVNPVLTSSY